MFMHSSLTQPLVAGHERELLDAAAHARAARTIQPVRQSPRLTRARRRRAAASAVARPAGCGC